MDYMSFGKLKMLTDTIKVDGHDSNYKIYSQTHLRPPLNLPQNLKNICLRLLQDLKNVYLNLPQYLKKSISMDLFIYSFFCSCQSADTILAHNQHRVYS